MVHSCSATFFDADNDGDLDLYVVNVGKFTSSQQDPENRYYAGTGLGLYNGLEKGETDLFYRNRGDGTFVDASREVGLNDTSWGGDVAAEDGDGDGFVDLYMANMYGEDALLINEQGKRFRNETHQLCPSTPYGAMGTAIADFDTDGDMDLFVPSGMGFPWEWWPNALLLNRGDGTFDEEGAGRGFDDPALGHALKRYRLWNRDFARSVRAGALLDYDGDGAEDAVTNGYNCHATLWRNVFAEESPGCHWLQLSLRGTRSNREAIGAQVTLQAGGRQQVRTVQGAHGYISQSWLVLTFGLDRATRVDSLVVRWPTGEEQQVAVPRVDARWRITEGQSEPELWEPHPVARRLPDRPLAAVGEEPEQRIRQDLVPRLGKRFGMGQLPSGYQAGKER